METSQLVKLLRNKSSATFDAAAEVIETQQKRIAELEAVVRLVASQAYPIPSDQPGRSARGVLSSLVATARQTLGGEVDGG